MALDRSPGSLPEALPARELFPRAEALAAAAPLERAEFAVVDLETTGLSAEGASILEIGAVRVVGLHEADRFETLVRPPGPVPRRITELTGIDERLLVAAPAAAAAVRAFWRWLARSPRATFVAHNAAFDTRFVARAFAVHGLPTFAGPVLCTRRLGRRLVPELGRYDLDHLCARFGVVNRARHRALGDAAATARVLVDLLVLARDAGGAATVGDLLDLQARRLRRRRRRRPSGRR